MSRQSVDVVIVGGGQAGLAMSYCLTEQGRPHVVLEQARIAESWRSKRWDSLRLIGPNWTFRLPGLQYQGATPDSFMSKDEVVTHLEAYAESFDCPRARRRPGDLSRARPGGSGLPGADGGRGLRRGPGRHRDRRAAAAVHSGPWCGSASRCRPDRPLHLPQPGGSAARGGAGRRQRPVGLPDR